MNLKKFKIVLIGGILVTTVGMFTGCGKKKDETKTYDKENEIVVTKTYDKENENVTESQSTVYSKSDFVGEWFDENATELFINEDGTFSADHLTASSTVFGIYEIKDNTIEFTCEKDDSTYGKKWTGKISKSENGTLTMNANLYDENSLLKKKSTDVKNNTESNTSTTSSASNWKSSYIEKVKATEKEVKAEQGDLYNDFENNYSIYDIDKDGTPELLVYTGTCEADWRLNVYTYKNNNLVNAGEISFSHSVLYIMNGEKYLKLINGHMGYEVVSKIYMNSNGELIKEKVSERELAQDEDYESGDKYLETYAYGDLSGIK